MINPGVIFRLGQMIVNGYGNSQATNAAEQTRQARILHSFQEGLEYLQQERWLDALVAFERYEVGVDSPPELFWNCALCLVGLSMPTDALFELNKIQDVAYLKNNQEKISTLRNAIEKGIAEQNTTQK